ncbi:MAG: allose kinase [Clostridia bacterium]|nr:allose kinase [Clostridia bacterium]
MNVLSIDIGGTSFRIGAVRADGSLIKFDKVPTSSVFRTENVLHDLVAYIQMFSGNSPIDALAIGFPATLNTDRSRIVQAPNIAFMENLPVCEVLRQALNIPVFAERDVTFALCFDMEKYQLSERGLTCGIYFGTGIGNAMLWNGKPVLGRHGAAGELGHIPVWGSTIPCGCGNVGCLEAVAGGKAIARLQRDKYPETPIGEMFISHGNEDDLLEIVNGMAMAVATEINMLDPDQVLVGGGVLNMKGFPLKVLDQMIQAHTRKPLPCEDLHMIYTEDEPDKSVIGGAVYARHALENMEG